MLFGIVLSLSVLVLVMCVCSFIGMILLIVCFLVGSVVWIFFSFCSFFGD